MLLAGLAAAPPADAQTAVTTWAQSYGVGSYDSQGNPVTYDLYGSGTDAPRASAAVPDGGLVVAGGLDLPELYRANSGHTGDSTTALVRYAADGHVVWQQLLRQDNDEYNSLYNFSTFHLNRVDQMLADAQGNLYLRMVKDPGAVSAPSATVAKFAPDGTLIWQATYGGDETKAGGAAGTSPFTSMSVTADGGVVVCGSEGAGGGSSQPFFAKINADGTPGAHRPFINIGQYDGAGAAAQSADGQHFVVALNACGAVVLTDAGGAILAERSFANDAGLTESPAHILANDDGTFTMLTIGAVTGGPYVYETTYIVRKLAADLTSLWGKVIANVSPSRTLGRTADGGYLRSRRCLRTRRRPDGHLPRAQPQAGCQHAPRAHRAGALRRGAHRRRQLPLGPVDDQELGRQRPEQIRGRRARRQALGSARPQPAQALDQQERRRALRAGRPVPLQPGSRQAVGGILPPDFLLHG